MAFRKALAGAAAAAASAAAAALLLAQGASAAVITRTAGVVVINTNLAYQNAAAAGTGMVLSSSGLVLTNNHVIKGATTIKVVVPATHRSYTATVLGYDTGNDVALLQLQGAKNLKTVTLGNSSKAKTGQSVTAIGNAGGTGVLTSATGRVTALRQAITASDEDGSSEQLTGLIQTNAGLQPGDSGGPLEDATGHVLGMDTAASSGFVMESQGNEAYAIPINKAVTIAKQIESGHSETAHIGATAFLGVSVEPVDQGGGGGPGALIAETVPGGPADQAGLVAGDVIVSFDGETVDSPTTLGALVLKHLPGDSVAVVYLDQLGDQQTITVTLGSGPPQ
ncbi:MAG TPA: trypsin-like peptidase domain-containing protein [Gaiellaceae bacterium]|nr:trypsin-like peptidase domain-containing protein [Gaiellaceae bacterium]